MATPYTTSCGIALTSIDGTDCIGDSRKIINGNITALGNTVCSISGFNVVDSNTIDLSWNSSIKTLSADVKPDSVRYSQLASRQTFSSSTLSGEAVQPRVAKAWVHFNGTTTVPVISSSFNVYGVERYALGHYKILFSTNMNTKQYTVLANGNVYSSATTAGYGIKADSSDPFSTSTLANNFDNALDLSAVKIASYQGFNNPVAAHHNFVIIFE
jgi:hypothetical protein